MNDSVSIGVCTVATGAYVDHWERMAESADRLLFPGQQVTLNVFTDQPTRVRRFAERLPRAAAKVFAVPSLGWPEATLYRYSLIRDHADGISGDLLMHVDADMLFLNIVGPSLQPQAWAGGLAFVLHPGYFRPRVWKRVLLYGRRPRLAFSDLQMSTMGGGIGAWESRSISRAFVPRQNRQRYYCGGVWFGLRESLVTMAGELAKRVSEDERAGIVALWHDESHLNRYATECPHAILGPEYCFAPGYTQLEDLEPLIVAVDKGATWTRE